MSKKPNAETCGGLDNSDGVELADLQAAVLWSFSPHPSSQGIWLSFGP